MFAVFFLEEMDPFYQNIASFPTIIFTFFLLVTLLYWALAILGLVDLEFLDFDLDIDGVADLNGTDPGLTNLNALAGLMMKYGLSGVPVTVIVSFISFFGWLICYYAVHFLNPVVPSGFLSLLVSVPVFLGSLYCSVMITSWVIRPLRPLFKNASLQTVKHVLGQTAVVKTSRVDENFGEAVLEDGGAGLIFKVRASPGTSFKLGDRVVLLEHDMEANTYRVCSEEEFNGQ